jgi:hypothetical protein
MSILIPHISVDDSQAMPYMANYCNVHINCGVFSKAILLSSKDQATKTDLKQVCSLNRPAGFGNL